MACLYDIILTYPQVRPAPDAASSTGSAHARRRRFASAPARPARVRYLRGLDRIDGIYVTTNGVLLDRFGIPEVLASGVTGIMISTSGFDRESYARIYRSTAYERMRANVTRLVQENAACGRPVRISIGLRADRPLGRVMTDPDFQPILRHHPAIDFTWAFTSAGGRITRAGLPPGMMLRTAPPKTEPCVNLYNGPIVRPNGDVIACSCVAAMDASPDLLIGNIRQESLLTLYRGERMRALRSQFRRGGPPLNRTCTRCDMYRNLDAYRSRAGRAGAEANRQRRAWAGPVEPAASRAGSA